MSRSTAGTALARAGPAVAVAACAAGALAPVGAASPAVRSSTVHVSPRGSDTSSGSARRPLRTVAAALDRRGVRSIVLAPGRYPRLDDGTVRRRTVTIAGPSRGRRAVISGAQLTGSTHLTFRDVSFDATVLASVDPARRTVESAHLRFLGVRMTTAGEPYANCLVLRHGTHDVLVDRARITRCFDGITTPGTRSVSGREVRRLTIRGSTISDMRSDGINAAYWQHATIRGNTIRRLRDPAGTIHNDAIQLMGGSTDVVIRDNVLRDSSTQLLFVEPTIGGPVRGLQVENNQIAGAGAAAVQLIDTPGARFVGNTVTSSRYAGLMLRHAPTQPAIAPQDSTVIANNVLAAGLLYDRIAPAREDANLVLGQRPASTGPRDLLGVDPVFRGAGADRHLRVGTPGSTGADPAEWRWRGTDPAARAMLGYLRPGLRP